MAFENGKIILDLIKQQRYEDAFILCRFLYKVSSGAVSNNIYDKLEIYCMQQGLAEEYLNRTYDDDPIPRELISEWGLERYIIENDLKERNEYRGLLDVDKSLSIKAVREYEEAWDFAQAHRGQRLVMSLKTDGINVKKAVPASELVVALSRGRDSESLDYTDQVLKVLPRKTGINVPNVKITSEAFVEESYLPRLRKKYPTKDYKTPKSAAMSMLRVMHDDEDYKHLKILSFSADGLSTSVEGSFKELEKAGFTVVPYFIIEAGEVPLERSEFDGWLRNKLSQMWDMGTGIPSDGVVLEVDDLQYVADIKHQYSSRNIALKMEQWGFDYYKGVLTGFRFEQQRVEMSCRGMIEPIVANDLTEAKVINLFNPKIIVENDLSVGKEILFERNSGAVNILLRGEKLKDLKLFGETSDAPL